MARKGIIKIKDIVEKDCNFKNITELENSSGNKNNIIMYNGLKSSIPRSWLEELKNTSKVDVLEKQNEFTIKINSVDKDVSEVKCKDFYWEYVSKKAL